MHKRISLINEDGEAFHNVDIKFTGRFHETNGYFLYSYGKTINSRTTSRFPEEMNKSDVANLMFLSVHLQIKTNILVYRTNKGDAPMKIKQISKVIGTQDRQTQRFLSKMIGLGMMKRVTVTIDDSKEIHYMINPLFFLNGKAITDELYWLFNEELNRELPKWVQDEYIKRSVGV